MNVQKRQIVTIAIFLLVGYLFQFVSVLAQSQITEIHTVAWSPDGTQIAMGGLTAPADFSSQTPILTIRNPTDMSLIADLASVPDGQTQQIMSVSWSPDGKYLASGSADGTIAVWAIHDPLRTAGQLLAKFGNYDTSVTYVRWSPDGKWIANIAYSEQIDIWNATNDDYHWVDGTPTPASASLSWSPNSEWLATSTDNGALVYNVTSTGTFVPTAQYRLSLDPIYTSASGVSWNASGSQVAVANHENNKIYIFDSSTHTPIRVVNLASSPGILAWSPDGTRFAFGSGTDSVQIVDASTGDELASYATGLIYPAKAVAWKFDSRKLSFSNVGDTPQVVSPP